MCSSDLNSYPWRLGRGYGESTVFFLFVCLFVFPVAVGGGGEAKWLLGEAKKHL